MTDHPSTFRGGTNDIHDIAWDDAATIHLREQGEGVLSEMGAINRGTMAEMVAMIAAMPEEERSRYYIQKAGDRRYEADEIIDLAERPDFPS